MSALDPGWDYLADAGLTIGQEVEFRDRGGWRRGEVRGVVETRERTPRRRALIRVAGYEQFHDLADVRALDQLRLGL